MGSVPLLWLPGARAAMTFRPPRIRYRKPAKAASGAAPEPTRSEYDLPGRGTIVFSSAQWPPFIAIRQDGVRLGARRSYGEAEELLEQEMSGSDVVARRAAE